MEFLDPEQKRQKTQKLFTTYFIAAISIAVLTFLLLMIVQGYQIRSQQGVVRSGLVFVASKPVAGDIELNGEVIAKTPSRLVLSESKYRIKITSEGYRPWLNNFDLPGGSVRYFSYPKLIPINIDTNVISNLNVEPLWMSQSPGNHWILVKTGQKDGSFLVYDTTKIANPAISFNLPSNVLLNQADFGEFSVVQWADNNRHILIRQSLNDGQQNYILLDREKPQESISLTKDLNLINQQTVKLKNNKWDKYFIHNLSSGELLSKNKDSIVSQKVAEGVLSFKDFGDDTLLYCTNSGAPESQSRLVIKDKKNLFNLKPLSRDRDSRCQLGIVNYNDTFYFYASTSSSDRVDIYQNPVNNLGLNQARIINPAYTLRIDNPKYISNSNNNRFIIAQSGNKFSSFDTEVKKQYEFTLPLQIGENEKSIWLDDYRLGAVVDQTARLFDFDGTNLQDLTKSNPSNSFYPAFTRDGDFVLTFVNNNNSKGTMLIAGSLIAK